MKVAVFFPDGDLVAGVQARALALQAGLATHGVETEAWSSARAGSPLADACPRAGMTLVSLGFRSSPPGHPFALLAWLALAPLRLLLLAWRLRRSGCQLLHLNGLLHLLPALAGRLAGLPCIWHLIGDHYPRWLVRLLVPLVRLLARTLITVDPAMSTFYRAGSCPVIAEPLISMKAKGSRQLWADRLGFDPQQAADEQWVIGVGHWNRCKNWQAFMDLANVLLHSREQAQVPNSDPKEKHAPMRFFLIGEPVAGQLDLARSIRHWAEQPRCHALSHGEIRAELHLFDLLLHPAKREGTPLVLLEAVAAGLPVLARPAGAISSMAADYPQHIHLLEASDPQDWRKAVEECLARARPPRVEILAKHRLETCLQEHLLAYRATGATSATRANG